MPNSELRLPMIFFFLLDTLRFVNIRQINIVVLKCIFLSFSVIENYSYEKSDEKCRPLDNNGKKMNATIELYEKLRTLTFIQNCTDVIRKRLWINLRSRSCFVVSLPFLGCSSLILLRMCPQFVSAHILNWVHSKQEWQQSKYFILWFLLFSLDFLRSFAFKNIHFRLLLLL